MESVQLGRRACPKSLARDEGYSAARIRAYLRKRGIRAVILYREDGLRRRRGKRGRPPKPDAEACRKRNAVERCFGWMKEMRAFATRSEKPEETFRATVHLATVRLCLNKIEPSDSA